MLRKGLLALIMLTSMTFVVHAQSDDERYKDLYNSLSTMQSLYVNKWQQICDKSGDKDCDIVSNLYYGGLIYRLVMDKQIQNYQAIDKCIQQDNPDKLCQSILHVLSKASDESAEKLNSNSDLFRSYFMALLATRRVYLEMGAKDCESTSKAIKNCMEKRHYIEDQRLAYSVYRFSVDKGSQAVQHTYECIHGPVKECNDIYTYQKQLTHDYSFNILVPTLRYLSQKYGG